MFQVLLYSFTIDQPYEEQLIHHQLEAKWS